jgi:enterochelin esterase-like enzyme
VLYRGDATNLTVSGDFDGWPNPGMRTFRRVGQTDLHVAEIPVATSARHQYKLTRATGNGTEWSTDPINRWVTWDGIVPQGPGAFNNEIIGSTHQLSESAIYRFFIRDRDVFLQLPIAHFDSISTMGVFYVHDGNEYLTRADAQTVADQSIASGRANPVAIGYIALPNQEIRYDEYTYDSPTANGDNYIAMIANEIIPEVEQYVRLAAMPDYRGVTGASLGGLIAFHAASTRNDLFHLLGGQSSSFWWNNDDMIIRFRDDPVIQARIYIDSGNPGDNTGVTRDMADVLEARGYDYLHIEEDGAQHEWPFWSGRFDEMLEFLY